MAKTMARIENGAVVNIEWRSNNTDETDSLKDVSDRVLVIGDTYDGVNFYRDGEKVLTPLEKAQAEVTALKEENASLKEENAMQTAQVSALSDQMDFYEECIVEMAEVVYA